MFLFSNLYRLQFYIDRCNDPHFYKKHFLTLVWVCNKLVLEWLSESFCFKYSKFSLAPISSCMTNKNCSQFQCSSPSLQLICNFVVLGSLSKIMGINKELNEILIIYPQTVWWSCMTLNNVIIPPHLSLLDE